MGKRILVAECVAQRSECCDSHEARRCLYDSKSPCAFSAALDSDGVSGTLGLKEQGGRSVSADKEVKTTGFLAYRGPRAAMFMLGRQKGSLIP